MTVKFSPDVKARLARFRHHQSACTLTKRLTDCWEYGCQGAEDCEYRKAGVADRDKANRGGLPGQVRGNW